MPASPHIVFERLRTILRAHAGALRVSEDSPTRYCLEGRPGPATLRAWGGTMKRPALPVAWVEQRKAYVSFHHMALYARADAAPALSEALRARLRGKTCFAFTDRDEPLLAEVEALTARGMAGMKKAGFVVDESGP